MFLKIPCLNDDFHGLKVSASRTQMKSLINDVDRNVKSRIKDENRNVCHSKYLDLSQVTDTL